MSRIAWLMTALSCLLACLAGCKTQYIPMPETHNLYHHASALRVDSVRIERFHSVIPLPTDTLNPSPFKGVGGAALEEILSQDPRPSYQDDPERIYHLDYDGYRVDFRVADRTCYVLNVDKM